MGHDKFSRVLIALDGSEPSMKGIEYGITIARKSNSSEIIALHVIHSQIKYLYSSTVATLVTSGTIDTIVDTAKQEAQKWITKVKEKADQNGVKLKTEFIVDPASVVGAIVDYCHWCSKLCPLSCISGKITICLRLILSRGGRDGSRQICLIHSIVV